MAGYPVTGDEYRSADKRFMELKRQMNQPGGCPIPPKLILDTLQRLIEGGARPSSSTNQSIIDPDVTLRQLSGQNYLHIQCVSILEWYGIRTLSDLSHFTETQVSEMRLIGAKRLSALNLLLGDAGLTFRTRREDDDWRRLHHGPIRRRQLLTLPVASVFLGYGEGRLYERIARSGIITFADYAFSGREGVKRSLGDEWMGGVNDQIIERIFHCLETPAYDTPASMTPSN